MPCAFAYSQWPEFTQYKKEQEKVREWPGGGSSKLKKTVIRLISKNVWGKSKVAQKKI